MQTTKTVRSRKFQKLVKAHDCWGEAITLNRSEHQCGRNIHILVPKGRVKDTARDCRTREEKQTEGRMPANFKFIDNARIGLKMSVQKEDTLAIEASKIENLIHGNEGAPSGGPLPFSSDPDC